MLPGSQDGPFYRRTGREVSALGVGTSLFLIAVGAVLRFAVSICAHGLSFHTIGVILMIAGVVGLLISFLGIQILRHRRDAATAYVKRDAPASGLLVLVK
jgi:hypothetical protein